MDFGSANESYGADLDGQHTCGVGTLLYASPEQLGARAAGLVPGGDSCVLTAKRVLLGQAVSRESAVRRLRVPPLNKPTSFYSSKVRIDLKYYPCFCTEIFLDLKCVIVEQTLNDERTLNIHFFFRPIYFR